MRKMVKTMIQIQDVPEDWQPLLAPLFRSDALTPLNENLQTETRTHTIYPEKTNWLRALFETPLHSTRVVILGQDPYHGYGQANGLAFSVSRDTPIPPSLRNIYKEVTADFNQQMPRHGDLTHWAQQGVLLLNTALTVRAGDAGSHRKIGWTPFTKAIIQGVSQTREGVIFLLWGRPAQRWGEFIDTDRHHVLTAPHPSPLSAYRGFFGCEHFSRANALLRKHKDHPIDWIGINTELA